MGVVTFNGLSSADYGLEVWQPPEYQIPERDYETVHIYGRDGDLVIDRGSFKNTSRTYIVSFGKDSENAFISLASKISEWLHSTSGYARLEDTYEPDYFRQALYYKSTSITNIYNKAGYVSVEFYCKPQRYLKTGENKITIRTGSSRTITNPTVFNARPIIKAYGTGSGTITINDETITISSIDSYVTIDCELMEMYKDDENCNSNIVLDNNKFPKFVSGSNTISCSGDITLLEVTPKWWII